MPGHYYGNEQGATMRAGTCKHFTGIQNDKCAIGIEYDSVRDESMRPFRWPCLDEPCATTCARKEPITAKEETEDRERLAVMLKKIGIAYEAIVASGIRSGSIPCPACGSGSLHFSTASNGHIHAGCTSEGCVRWME